MVNSVKVNGIKIYSFENRDDFLKFIKDKKKILIAMNIRKILKTYPELEEIINQNIGYCDSESAVMALRQKGYEAIKIPGADFWLDIIRKYHHNKKFYLIGATQETIEKTVEKLKKEFPNINIAGFRNGFIKEGDKEKLIEELNNKKPDIVFVAQGTPRQEILMDELIKEHPALYMGLGGSFDAYTGLVKRAPKWIIDLKLEGILRDLQRPKRIPGLRYQIIFLFLLFSKRL